MWPSYMHQYVPCTAREKRVHYAESGISCRGFKNDFFLDQSSYHMEAGIDMAVTAFLSIFTSVTGAIPKFTANGGSVRENVALQNVQVSPNPVHY